jgi:hypothetical protein
MDNTPSASPELIVSFSAGRNGHGILKATVGDQVVFADKVDVAKESTRVEVAARLAKDRPGIDAEAVAAQLLEIAGKLAGPAPRRNGAGGGPAPSPDTQYQVVDGRLCRKVVTPFGETAVPLCNFNAWIVEEVVRDDGVEQTRRLVLEGTLATGERLPPVEVAIEEFSRGDWPLIRHGSRAVVYSGPGTKDNMRVAIQLLSGQVEKRTIYTATGWRFIDGIWCYLHGGGAIGPNGHVDGVSVDLPDALTSYRLPDPLAGEPLVAAVRAVLGIGRDLAPDRIALLLLMVVFRSVLAMADFAAHLCGRTGSFKTELAALIQQFFGASMDARNLPANWSSTSNALEAIAFAAMEAILVVDDFAPSGNTADVNRYHREAERLVRAQGNRSGRQRLRADGSIKVAKPPRGLILSTGEDVPRGHSVRARLLTIEVERTDVDPDRLTECQRDAASGLYAAAMAGYLMWLAPRLVAVRDELGTEGERLRGELGARPGKDQHRRTPTLVADLLAGFSPFLTFAREVGALSPEGAEDLRQRCCAALLSASAEQTAYQEDSDPCDRYLALLRSVLSSGRAHFAGPKGERPDDLAQACGWRSQDNPNDPGAVWQPQGRRIGWLDNGDLYLDPDAAFAECQELGNRQGEPLTVSRNTLHKRLHERGLLASTEENRNSLVVRRTLEGTRHRVLHLRAEQVLCRSENDPTGPTGPDGENSPGNGPPDGVGSRPAPEKRPTPTAQNSEGNTTSGPIGPVGPPPKSNKPRGEDDHGGPEEMGTWRS